MNMAEVMVAQQQDLFHGVLSWAGPVFGLALIVLLGIVGIWYYSRGG